MKKRRMIPMLVALVCLIAILAACGSEPEETTLPAASTQTSAPTETTEPAVSWETNYLKMDEEVKLVGDTMEDHFVNAGKLKVFGSDIMRNQIKSVTFLDTLADIPSSAWDVSAVGNGSVMAWVKLNAGLYDLYIAAEGGINAVGQFLDALLPDFLPGVQAGQLCGYGNLLAVLQFII